MVSLFFKQCYNISSAKVASSVTRMVEPFLRIYY
nr:MAG TPA: hypothetical protein [Caudoviricetes sp.]